MSEVSISLPNPREVPKNFKPDQFKIYDVLNNIDRLQDGEILKISASFFIISIGGKKIAIDPALIGRSFKKSESGKLIPPSGGIASHSVKLNAERYTHTMIEAPPDENSNADETNTSRVGRILADRIDAVLISHLDADHYDFELIRTMMETNENLEVFGPLSWKTEIAKHHSLESMGEKGEKPTKNYMPDKLFKRLKTLSGKTADPEKNIGLRYNNLNLDKAELKSWIKDDNQPGRYREITNAKISAIEIPHTGGLPAEYVQGFVIENENNRIMVIPDSALSPEAVEHIKKNVTDSNNNKLTQLIVSTGTLNPETFYGLPHKLADYIRDNIEESIAHSAYLPLVAAAYTDGETDVNLSHAGFYYRSSSNKAYFRTRYPQPKDHQYPDAKVWLEEFRDYIDETMEEMKTDIKSLGPLTSSVEKSTLIRDFPIRRKFALKLIKWLKQKGVPDSVLGKIHNPEGNTIIKKVASAS